ncbi:MAG: hypothetical protein EAX86_02590 [Candidatus Heimdallarchaeota archaeon]|nr:hypothetical protein [Candidatus Heimdallarchaeota archaeon]
MEKEIPIFVESFFKVSSTMIKQSLYFYYEDVNKNYYNLKATGAISGELELIKNNLQYWINIDDLLLNQKKIQMTIQNIQLHFFADNPEKPVLKFLIESDPFQLKRTKVNTIHLYAQPEEITYPAISSWQILAGTIKAVYSGTEYIINKEKSIVTFYISKGEIIGGNEKIFLMLEE